MKSGEEWRERLVRLSSGRNYFESLGQITNVLPNSNLFHRTVVQWGTRFS